MKHIQYKTGGSPGAVIIIICLLLSPIRLLPGNHSLEIDIGMHYTLDCPDDISVGNDPGECSAIVSFTPPANSYLVLGQLPNTSFGIGTTLIQYNLNDDSDSCQFTVTVSDTEAPEFTFCPEDIIKSYDDGLCQDVFYEAPEATDNCGVISVTQISGLPSGSIFPIGTTVNEFEAIDAAGNTAICSFTVEISGGHTTVLATDGSSSDLMAPQGELRYQRVFCLVTADEMSTSDIEAGMEINSIGFTIGASQSDTTHGDFKVYLQNTTDNVSRMDTTWITEVVTTNSYTLSGINPGEYEWQVRSMCSGASPFSDIAVFANDELEGCNQPYNLHTEDIAQTSVKLVWESAGSLGFTEFKVEYSLLGTNTWTAVTTTESFVELTGLVSDTTYQWKVRSLCGTNSSAVSAREFMTAGDDICEEPTLLAVGTIGDSSAVVSWSEDTPGAYYRLSYRRAGTTSWIDLFSNKKTYTLLGLLPGTPYEWKVRTVCADGSGAYVDGQVFTTSGTPICYAPEELKTSSISETGAILSWNAFPGADEYLVRYRPKESIEWANAIDGMTLVSDDQLTIPDTIGQYDVKFESGSPFTYDGNGLYVAWEYSNATGFISTANKSLCTKQNTSENSGNLPDSLKSILSFNGRTRITSTAMPDLLRSTPLRPEMRLGSSALQDSVEVTAIYTLGQVAMNYGSPVPIAAMIRNFSDEERTYPVTLDVVDRSSGNVRSSITQDLIVPASCSGQVIFPDWIPGEMGTDSIVVSIPTQAGENVVDNNMQYYLQNTNTYYHSYADESPVVNGAGFGNGAGLILSRFSMNGCGKVNSAKIFLHFSAAGNPLHAVILDASGNILDVSSDVTLDSTQVNDYYSFYFPQSPLITDADYYVGLAQAANPSEAYTPVGVQWESNIIREQAYYRADPDGSNIIDQPYPGRLMIKAEIIPGMDVPFISGSDILCDGNTNTLAAASKTVIFADAVIDKSSESSEIRYGAIKALGSPDVYPEYLPSPNAWISETPDGQREFIKLHFPELGRINYIDIYQTMNPGAIDTVYVIDSVGNEYPVYTEKAIAGPEEASILEIRFSLTSFRTSAIKIELGSDSVGGFHAIDAVSIGKITEPPAYTSYSWEPGGASTSSIDVSSPGMYKLTVTNAAGCSLSDSLLVETPTITTPTITLSGAAEFCAGDSVILTSSEAEGNTWSTGETTQSIVVGTSGDYNVTYFNGCESATSADVSITVNELPVVNITGGPMCPGSTTTLSAQSGFASYVWSTGDSVQSITVGIANLYKVYVTDDNGCEGMGYVSTYYAPAPSPTISGDPFYCPGDSALLDAGAAYTSYLWSTGATTRKIYVKTPGTVSVVVTNQDGCSGDASVVTGEYIPPQPFISGSLSLCFGSATILDAGEGYLAYLWSTGETTSSIVVDTANTFTVFVIDGNGCEGSASATTNLDGAIPEVPGPIFGPESGVCQQTGLEYSIDPVANTTHYVWTVPEGMTITDGQGTTSILVDAGIVTIGKITVAASNTCGQSPTWNGRVLTVKGTPGTPPEIYGQSTGVCGLSGLVYFIDPVYGTSSYLWTVPSGASITSGNGTSSITVSFDPGFVSGTIYAQAENACGPGESSSLKISSEPAMPVEIYGPDEVCRKQKNVLYSVDPVFNATSYYWTVPLQATIKSGQGTGSIMVDFGNKSGFVTVRTENGCGQSSTLSFAVEVVLCDNNGVVINTNDLNGNGNDDPYANGSLQAFYPEVIANAGGFSTGRYYTLSWTLGESVIETRESERTKITQGFHQAYYLILPLGDQTEEFLFEVKVYPVPTRDLVNIHISSTAKEVDLILELVDQLGEVVYKEEVRSREFTHQLGLAPYPSNVFVLQVTDTRNNNRRLFKIIKLK